MFLGGANQQPDDGIRPPSVKGALRFWWRAVNWSRFRIQHADDARALSAMHQSEAETFGIATDGLGKSGQGSFLLKVVPGRLAHSETGTVHKEFRANDASRYLGYGLVVAYGQVEGPKASGQLERGCFNHGQEFTIRLIFREKVDPTVQEALIAWGLLGGLGSRVRHGMGSVALSSMQLDGETIWTSPASPDEYHTKILGLLSATQLLTKEPPFSAFSKLARVDQLVLGASAFDVLNALGGALLMYRSWGRNGSVNGQTSEKRFKPDHDWSKGVRPNGFHPQRVVFGLPHNYGKAGTLKINAEHSYLSDEQSDPSKRAINRRSSPLLFHVHQVGSSFVGMSVYLRAEFLPSGAEINAGGTRVPMNIEWSKITDFIDGKVGNPATVVDRFPGKTAVLP